MEDIYSIIDVGTNNVLLLIAQKKEYDICIIKKKSKISFLGKKMQNNFLQKESINWTKKILENFISISKNYTENIIIIGTSCSRKAKNINLLSGWLKKKYQLNYQIISGEKEAYLNGLANINEFNDQENIILFDVGGGSTEFTLIKNKEIVSMQSIELGIHYLVNEFGNDFNKKREKTKKLLSSLKISLNNAILIGIGGTATSLSAMKQKMISYNSKQVHKSVVYSSDIENLLMVFRKSDLPTIRKMMEFDPDRSEIIATGTMIIQEILAFLGYKEFYVSDHGFQYGVLFLETEERLKMI